MNYRRLIGKQVYIYLYVLICNSTARSRIPFVSILLCVSSVSLTMSETYYFLWCVYYAGDRASCNIQVRS